MYCRAREWSVMREKNQLAIESYEGLLQGVVHLLERARTASARSVNAIMTSTYWEIGRRIVEYEQKGERRAAYGQAFLARLAADLAGRFGRGFSERNLGKMRLFYLSWKIPPTLTAKSPDAVSTGSGKPPTVSAKSQEYNILQTGSAGQGVSVPLPDRPPRPRNPVPGNRGNQTCPRNTSGPTRITSWLSFPGNPGTK